MNKEDNLKMVIPEIEPLQKKLDEEPTVYQACSEDKTVKLGNIKLQVRICHCSVHVLKIFYVSTRVLRKVKMRKHFEILKRDIFFV